MTTHLRITFENGNTADMGPQHPPYDAIGTARALLLASQDVAYVEWKAPGYVAFAATRVSTTSFGWKSSAMPAYAFGVLA